MLTFALFHVSLYYMIARYSAEQLPQTSVDNLIRVRNIPVKRIKKSPNLNYYHVFFFSDWVPSNFRFFSSPPQPSTKTNCTTKPHVS